MEADLPYPNYTASEIGARGREIYEKSIRPKVEPQHVGKYLVVNTETGDYELDVDGEAVTRRCAARWPGAPLYGIRIGYPNWGHIGAHARPRTR